MNNKVDLEILEDTVILNRDVKAGEVITYQNNYLRGINAIDKANVFMDLSKDSKLVSGYYSEGLPVITANEGTEDFLIVKLVK